MNRVRDYFTKIEPPPAFRILAVGPRITEVCRTDCYFDAAMEADELVREGKLASLFPGVEYLVVMDAVGRQCGGRFEVGVTEALPAAPPAPLVNDFALRLFLWLCLAGLVAIWLSQ